MKVTSLLRRRSENQIKTKKAEYFDTINIY